MSKIRLATAILTTVSIASYLAVEHFTGVHTVKVDKFTAIAVDTKYAIATYFKQFPFKGAMWYMEWKSPASDRYIVETHNGEMFGTNIPVDGCVNYVHGFYVSADLPDKYLDLSQENLEKVENVVYTDCEILTKFGRKRIDCFEYPRYLQAKSVSVQLDYANRIKGVEPDEPTIISGN